MTTPKIFGTSMTGRWNSVELGIEPGIPPADDHGPPEPLGAGSSVSISRPTGQFSGGVGTQRCPGDVTGRR